MKNDDFESDDQKAVTNARKHRVTFEQACAVFDDPAALTDIDDNPDEDRVITIGMAAKAILSVVSTMRGIRIRIISARKANKHEQNRYQRAATPGG
jgi:uncharacterized protein